MVIPKIAWLIFIRANSRRFPGKCYRIINGKNILDHLLCSANSLSISSSDLFLCTSHNRENLPLVNQGQERNINILFGSEESPIQRITDNWERLISYDYLVRICGDSPFYPFETVGLAISHYSKDETPIAITNTRLRNFPSGFSIEIYHIEALKRFLMEFPVQAKQEHMSSILKHPYFAKDLSIDIRTKKPLAFFHYKKYTVDEPCDIAIIEQCIHNGYAQYYSNKLAEVEFV